MKRLLAVVCLVPLLIGCSGMRVVESQVRAASTLPEATAALSGARYRFERLPSQTDPVATESAQAIAEAELAEVGLVHDDAAARYSVQLTTRMQSFLVDEWGHPIDGGRVHGAIMIGGGIGNTFGFGLGTGFPPSAQYRHEVGLLLRDLGTGQLVYETSATHVGPWSDRYNILRALLAAALKDFPNPPAGSRLIKVEIPR
jgi:hypothetical protein